MNRNYTTIRNKLGRSKTTLLLEGLLLQSEQHSGVTVIFTHSTVFIILSPAQEHAYPKKYTSTARSRRKQGMGRGARKWEEKWGSRENGGAFPSPCSPDPSFPNNGQVLKK